jgi:hypothetical protein
MCRIIAGDVARLKRAGFRVGARFEFLSLINSRVVIWSGHTGLYEDPALLFGKYLRKTCSTVVP